MLTDIVMTSRNRLDYLQQSIDFIVTRTKSPYALHVIDDNSDKHIVDYLYELWKQGIIKSLTLNNERRGVMANKNLSTWLSFSNPFVITADDILCPDIEPDWLSQGLQAMRKYPQLGILDLNHPGAWRGPIEPNGEITYCDVVGGTLGFIRREFIQRFHLAHFRGNFGQTDDVQRCGNAKVQGWKVAYLTNVYCYHIGRISSLTEAEYTNGPFIEPKDWKTLEPNL